MGEFSQLLCQKFQCQCFAVEPVPTLYEKIPINIGINKFNVAVAAQNGRQDFYLSDNQEANTLARPTSEPVQSKIVVQTLTLASFLEQQKLPTVDLLKVDIEGAEIAVFASTPDEILKCCRQITVEFHDFLMDRVTRSEVVTVRKRLEALGFACIVFTHRHHDDVLFINRRLVSVSNFQLWVYRTVWKYALGLARIFKRWAKLRK
jgi:FkbM family methyltransferase